MMGVMKEFFRMYAQANNFPGTIANDQGDHGYAMTQQSDQGNLNNSCDSDAGDGPDM